MGRGLGMKVCVGGWVEGGGEGGRMKKGRGLCRKSIRGPEAERQGHSIRTRGPVGSGYSAGMTVSAWEVVTSVNWTGQCNCPWGTCSVVLCSGHYESVLLVKALHGLGSFLPS